MEFNVYCCKNRTIFISQFFKYKLRLSNLSIITVWAKSQQPPIFSIFSVLISQTLKPIMKILSVTISSKTSYIEPKYSGASDPGGQLPTQYLRESSIGGKNVCKNFFCPLKNFSAHPIQNPFRRPCIWLI